MAGDSVPAGDGGLVVTRETHSAVVFLVADRAYKLKNPVNLGFLDFTTRAARQAVCRREVELNRRLAPDVYLGVADIHGPDGELCDHLVVMRRMPAERRLATLVRAGAPVDDHLRAVARQIAAFHATARRGPDISAEGSRDAVLGRWRDSFAQVRPFRGTVLDDCLTGEIEQRTIEFLAGRGPLFADRIAAGRVVDGHGDLTAAQLRAGAVALVLVGGLPGTGKSTLAGHLADRLGAVLLATDRLRKELAGLTPHTPAPAGYRQGIYTPDATDKTYTELLARAGKLLTRGETVVLDASFNQATHREAAAAVAARTRSALVALRCRADPTVTAGRLRRRAHTESESDADVGIGAAMAAHSDPWPQATTIRTDTTPDRAVAQALVLVRPPAVHRPVARDSRQPRLPRPDPDDRSDHEHHRRAGGRRRRTGPGPGSARVTCCGTGSPRIPPYTCGAPPAATSAASGRTPTVPGRGFSRPGGGQRQGGYSCTVTDVTAPLRPGGSAATRPRRPAATPTRPDRPPAQTRVGVPRRVRRRGTATPPSPRADPRTAPDPH